MGYCSLGGSTQPCTQEECAEQGWKYSEEKGGTCFLLSVLEDERAILITETTMYPAMIQFRDEIMRRTPLGRKLIAYFDEFYEEAKTLARQDPTLITEVIWLAVYISPFIQAMLGQKPVPDSTIETPLSRLASEYRPSTHKAFVSVVNRLKAKGSMQFGAALDSSEQIISRFVGLTPTEALRQLRRPASSEVHRQRE